MSEPTNLFWYSSVAVQFFFCVHLLWTRLAKNHPVFTFYLGCSVLRSLIAMRYRVAANGALPLSYTYFWLWSEPFLLLLQIGIVLEVHSAVWKHKQTPVAHGRLLLILGLLLAIGFAALPVRAELGRMGGGHVQSLIQFEFLAKRYVSTVLAAFLILSAACAQIVHRIGFRAMLFRHESMLAAYLGIYAIFYLVAEMGWVQVPLLNHYMLSALTLCLVIWMSVFRPQQAPADK